MFDKTKARIHDELSGPVEKASAVLETATAHIATALYIVAGFLAMILLALVTRAR